MAKHIVVTGIVQGVGFRPFVYRLATWLNLRGWVCRTSRGVEILVDGQAENLERFIRSLSLEKPAQAKIDLLQVEETPFDLSPNFVIHDSEDVESTYQPVAADIAICPDCERELFNPKDPRYLYPFISCSHCGPRFTIIKDVPYTRSNTTLGSFPMCDPCRSEYDDPQSRRFRAQPIACPDCGPFVELRETHSQFPTTDPRISSIEIRLSAILKARRLLREGYIVAIKGLGGFYLACDASNPYTVAELRDRKGRIDKPFAVMAANVTAVVSVCELSREEQLLLTSREKPIVVLERKPQETVQLYKVSELVAPNLDTLGIMLPSTPLHHLLLNQTDPILAREPVPPILVMTSSNFREEPIAIENQEALRKLSLLADAFLLHNCDIHIRCDDSVAKVDGKNIIYLRRSRGYAPYPVELSFDVRPTLALGGELRNTFCMARDHSAFLSQHVGNLRNIETHEGFENGLRHLARLFRVQPEIVAHDLSPDYFTTQYAKSLSLPRIAVQHHHAHLVSCMVDNGLDDRPVIGLVFDGGGRGTDGMTWGGEALTASFGGFERFAHFEYLPLPGGDLASYAPWRIAAGYAHILGIAIDDLPFVQNVDKQVLRTVRRQMDGGLAVPLTSSVGRLFNAVASLVGVRNEITYETQAAMELEALSKPFIADAKAYPYIIDETPEGRIVRLQQVLESIVEDVRANRSLGRIGANFHRTLAEIAIDLCGLARAATGLKEVALSGGVWQNRLLLDLVRRQLKQDRFSVYVHTQVPSSDGGLSLGQAVIANHVVAKQHSAAEAVSL